MSSSPLPDFTIRQSSPADVPEIARLIRALARYEKLENQCDADEDRLATHLFGPRSFAEAWVAETADRIVGFALFFHNYSTFRALPGIYLEDIFVEPVYRRRGIGRALLQRIVDLGRERGCGRVEWMVLDWNEPAMNFYRDTFGAEVLREWVLNRVSLQY